MRVAHSGLVVGLAFLASLLGIASCDSFGASSASDATGPEGGAADGSAPTEAGREGSVPPDGDGGGPEAAPSLTFCSDAGVSLPAGQTMRFCSDFDSEATGLTAWTTHAGTFTLDSASSRSAPQSALGHGPPTTFLKIGFPLALAKATALTIAFSFKLDPSPASEDSFSVMDLTIGPTTLTLGWSPVGWTLSQTGGASPLMIATAGSTSSWSDVSLSVRKNTPNVSITFGGSPLVMMLASAVTSFTATSLSLGISPTTLPTTQAIHLDDVVVSSD